MPLILIGMNHRTAAVELREQFSLSEASAPEALKAFRAISSVRGIALLSTCNRVEALASVDNEDVIEPLVQALVRRTAAPTAEVEKHLYVLRNRDVVRHLFRVASGLDSMIVGEPQIGGQVRAAYRLSQDCDTLDPLLQRLFHQTLRVAKKIRSETGISENAVSIPFAAVELARKIFGNLSELHVLLLGAGEIGELTAENLRSQGVKHLTIANRVRERAAELASRFGGQAVDYDRLADRMADADIVIASTSASGYLVTAEEVRMALSDRKGRSLFLIDLAVPRNLDPEIAGIDSAYLYNIDDLNEVADLNRAKRLARAAVAEEIIEGEVDGFLRRQATDDAIPTIVELRARLEEIRTSELEKCLRKVGPVTAEQHQAIEGLTTSIINKILHYPIIHLKESADQHPQERESLRQTIRNIFGLR